MNQPISGGGTVAKDNKQALWSVILGIIGIVLCCGPAGIVAWVMGRKELQAIDSGVSAEENRSMANAGKILGIIGTELSKQFELRKTQAALWLLAPLVGASAWVLARFVSLREGAEYSICLLRRTTGIPCPGCGLTRACVHLARGEWTAAMADHPLALLLVAETIIAWVVVGAFLWRRGTLAPLAVGRSTNWANLWLISHVVGLGALWLGRMATGTLPW